LPIRNPCLDNVLTQAHFYQVDDALRAEEIKFKKKFLILTVILNNGWQVENLCYNSLPVYTKTRADGTYDKERTLNMVYMRERR
jgi:hypothetical protein